MAMIFGVFFEKRKRFQFDGTKKQNEYFEKKILTLRQLTTKEQHIEKKGTLHKIHLQSCTNHVLISAYIFPFIIISQNNSLQFFMEDFNYFLSYNFEYPGYEQIKTQEPTIEALEVNQPTQTVQRTLPNMLKIIEAKKASSYYWSDTQNRRYLGALIRFQHLFQLSAQERRLKKVNVTLSRRVRTRTALQCHSHHQKMVQKYGSIQGIIQNLTRNLSTENQSNDPNIPPPKRRGRKPKVSSLQIPVRTQQNPREAIPVSDVFLETFSIMERIELLAREEEFNERQLMSWINLD